MCKIALNSVQKFLFVHTAVNSPYCLLFSNPKSLVYNLELVGWNLLNFVLEIQVKDQGALIMGMANDVEISVCQGGKTKPRKH
jgi:hypothetical protein